jgi:hypothetical protein
MRRIATAGLAVAVGLIVATAGTAPTAGAHTTGIHDNCTKLNQKWPHGVGTRRAVDKTSGTRVTSFYRNTKAYWAAERHNGTLDRDNDRIACEKA